MLSIKDFARDCGVSYEAVRKQIKRYEGELQGHIHRQGRTQYLDDVAIAFLNEHRASAPMAIYSEDSMLLQIQDLQVELKEAYKEQAALSKQLLDLQGAQARLEAAEASQRFLEESRDEYRAEAARNAQAAAEAAQRAQEAAREAQELRSRLDSVEEQFRSMSLWEFLREKRKKGKTQ